MPPRLQPRPVWPNTRSREATRGYRKARVRGLCAALGTAEVGHAVTEDIEDPAERARVTTLPNGLTVLTLVDESTPVVSFQVWVRAGSGDESKYTGIAHLFEHMMFRGSKNLPPEAHSKLIEARGGRVNAFTSRDVTVYFADISPEHLPLVIELEAERLRNLDISEESLASERQVVLEERRLRTEDNPQGRAFEALLALAFQAHPYRHPTIGWRADVEAVTVAASQAFFERYYAANNLVVAVAGNFDEADTLEQIREQFGPLPKRDPPVRNPTTEPEQSGERRAVVHFPVRSPVFAVAWQAPETGHPDSAALDVASTMLSGGRTSRLYRRLVYTDELALSASGYYWELARGGVFYGFAGVRPGVSIEDVEAAFFEEVAKLASGGLSEAELEKAKRKLEVSLLGDLATSHAQASRLGGDTIAFGRVRPLSERLASIRGVSAADVARVAATYLPREKRSVVHVLPPPPEETAMRGAAPGGRP
jgi:predicted Zn-dependent peptidase